MSECANIEMREMLPELLHGMLSAGERVRVERHLAVCADCQEELALLRGALGAMRADAAPAVDTHAVVAALRRSATAVPASRHRSPLAFRMAAALTVISLGGMSLLVARDRMSGARTTVGVDTTAPAPVSRGATVAVAPAAVGSDSPAARAEGGLSTGGVITELGDAELRTLLGELERLEAAPAVEPESTPGERLVTAGANGTEG